MHLRACELCGMCMEPMDHMHPLGRTGGTAVGSQQVKVTPKTAFTSKWTPSGAPPGELGFLIQVGRKECL